MFSLPQSTPALLSLTSLELLMLSQHRLLQACAQAQSHRGAGLAAVLAQVPQVLRGSEHPGRVSVPVQCRLPA